MERKKERKLKEGRKEGKDGGKKEGRKQKIPFKYSCLPFFFFFFQFSTLSRSHCFPFSKFQRY